ncbi:MAG: hypothetical protein ACJZ37_01270 [Candidatus Poseidoniales archaeon]
MVITGADMGLGKQLEKEASEKGVKMHRLGHIDDETYRSVLAAAEMLVLPSEYEAFVAFIFCSRPHSSLTIISSPLGENIIEVKYPDSALN